MLLKTSLGPQPPQANGGGLGLFSVRCHWLPPRPPDSLPSAPHTALPSLRPVGAGVPELCSGGSPVRC